MIGGEQLELLHLTVVQNQAVQTEILLRHQIYVILRDSLHVFIYQLFLYLGSVHGNKLETHALIGVDIGAVEQEEPALDLEHFIHVAIRDLLLHSFQKYLLAQQANR